MSFFIIFIVIFHKKRPGRVAQSVGHLTRKSGVLGSIPGLATYFRFSFRFFKKGSCQLLAKVCAVRLTDRPDMTLDVYRGRKTTTQQQQQQIIRKELSFYEKKVLPRSKFLTGTNILTRLTSC